MWRGFEKNMTEGSGGDFWINQHDMYGTGSKVKKRGKARYTYQISRDFLERLSSEPRFLGWFLLQVVIKSSAFQSQNRKAQRMTIVSMQGVTGKEEIHVYYSVQSKGVVK